jgi:branched-chain amino acid transport system permease protein
MGATLNAHGVDAWLGAGLLLLVSLGLFELTRREFKRQWDQTQEEIEKEIKRREAL